MSLPDVCPLDDKPCKGRECHLYCVEWRTQEPMCLVGYRSTGKTGPNKVRFEDTYAENTFKKLGRQSGPGQQTVPDEDGKDKKPAEKKRGKFKPWPEFPVNKHTDKASEGSHNEKLRSWEAVRPYEGLKPEGLRPENPGRSGEAVRHNDAKRSSLRHEALLNGKVADEKKLPIKKPPQFKERVVSKDIHATIFSSVSESEKSAIRPSDRERDSGRKPDEEREKCRKLDKVMKLDLPDEYEDEFWS